MPSPDAAGAPPRRALPARRGATAAPLTPWARRRAAGRRVMAMGLVTLVATAGLTALPLVEQAHSSAASGTASIDEAARAAAESGLSRGQARNDAAALAENRRQELQLGSIAQDDAGGAADQRRASLAEITTLVSSAAQAQEIKKVLDVRAQQEAQRMKDLSKLAGVITPGAAAALALDPAATGRIVSPMAPGTYSLTAHWGDTGLWFPYHTGQDFGAPEGTPVYATTDAIVGYSIGDWWPGNHVVLYHGDGTSTLYAHLADTTVKTGMIVHAGDLIGHVGNTGRSFGAHLHFEVYPPGAVPGDNLKCVDEAVWLRQHGVQI